MLIHWSISLAGQKLLIPFPWLPPPTDSFPGPWVSVSEVHQAVPPPWRLSSPAYSCSLFLLCLLVAWVLELCSLWIPRYVSSFAGRQQLRPHSSLWALQILFQGYCTKKSKTKDERCDPVPSMHKMHRNHRNESTVHVCIERIEAR